VNSKFFKKMISKTLLVQKQRKQQINSKTLIARHSGWKVQGQLPQHRSSPPSAQASSLESFSPDPTFSFSWLSVALGVTALCLPVNLCVDLLDDVG
jgi:hypothetical protein